MCAALLDSLLEGFAGGELRNAALRDLDGGAGLGVAGGARLAVQRLEGAEADERDRVALLERSRDAVDQRVDRGGGARLRETSVFRDLRDDLLFVHGDLRGEMNARLHNKSAELLYARAHGVSSREARFFGRLRGFGSRGFARAELVERAIENRIRGRRRLSEFDVGLVDDDLRFEA